MRQSALHYLQLADGKTRRRVLSILDHPKGDLRLAAIRALGNYQHYDTTRALLEVMSKEKDVALKDRAHEALQTATGKNLPPDLVIRKTGLAGSEYGVLKVGSKLAQNGPPPLFRGNLRFVNDTPDQVV